MKKTTIISKAKYLVNKIEKLQDDISNILPGNAADVDAPSFKSRVSAKETLGGLDQDAIEFWYISFLFLIYHHELENIWLQLSESLGNVNIFSGDQELLNLDNSVISLVNRNRTLASRLLCLHENSNQLSLDDVLNERLDDFSPLDLLLGTEKWPNSIAPREFCRFVISTHSFLKSADHNQELQGKLPRTKERAESISQNLVTFWDNHESEHFQIDSLFFLKNYQKANFQPRPYSGKTHCSAFETIMTFVNPINYPSAYELLRKKGFNHHMPNLAALLDKTQKVSTQAGYNDLISKILGDEDTFQALENEIDILPRIKSEENKEILLVLSDDSRDSNIKLMEMLKAVRSYLIKHLASDPHKKTVVILCNKWNPSVIEESIWDLRAWKRKGIEFLFMLHTPIVGIQPLSLVI